MIYVSIDIINLVHIGLEIVLFHGPNVKYNKTCSIWYSAYNMPHIIYDYRDSWPIDFRNELHKKC